jgi:hypothetical protein
MPVRISNVECKMMKHNSARSVSSGFPLYLCMSVHGFSLLGSMFASSEALVDAEDENEPTTAGSTKCKSTYLRI